MKREHWIGLLIIALVVGMLIGYGVWGTQAAQLANLNSKVQQLTTENAELKSNLATASAHAAQGSQARPQLLAAPRKTSPEHLWAGWPPGFLWSPAGFPSHGIRRLFSPAGEPSVSGEGMPNGGSNSS